MPRTQLNKNQANDSDFALQSELDAHTTDQANPHVVTKDQVGLGNVDNTSDLDKPVSTQTQAAFDFLVSNIAISDEFLQDQIDLKAPIESPTFTGTVSGVTKEMVGLGNVDNTSDLNKPISTTTQSALDGKEPANSNIQAHISSTSNPHSVTKAQVGLGNADNTSDLNKPISTATQSALDLKVNTSDTAVISTANKLLYLNSSGLFPFDILDDYYQYDERTTSQSTTATTSGGAARYRRMTTASIPAGTYRLEVAFEYGHSSTTANKTFEIRLDGTIIRTFRCFTRQNSASVNNFEPFSSKLFFNTATTATHTIDIYMWSSSGTVQINGSRMEIKRIA